MPKKIYHSRLLPCHSRECGNPSEWIPTFVGMTLFGIVILLVSSFSYADADDVVLLPNDPCCVLKDGFYLGVAGGFDVYRAKNTAVNHVSVFSFSEDPVLSLTGGVGGAFAGYGQYFSRFYHSYLGIEVFANGSAAETDQEITFQTTTSSGSYLTQVKAKNNFGISLLPGVKFSPGTLLYIRLGANGSKINVDEFLNSPSHMNDQQTLTPMLYGFCYGLGIESIFFDDFSLRVEYTHAGYNDFQTDIGTNIKMSNNEFMFGLNYHFDFF